MWGYTPSFTNRFCDNAYAVAISLESVLKVYMHKLVPPVDSQFESREYHSVDTDSYTLMFWELYPLLAPTHFSVDNGANNWQTHLHCVRAQPLFSRACATVCWAWLYIPPVVGKKGGGGNCHTYMQEHLQPCLQPSCNASYHTHWFIMGGKLVACHYWFHHSLVSSLLKSRS